MYQDEKGHTQWKGVTIYSSKDELAKFIEFIGGVDKLNQEQKKMYNSLMGINEVVQDEFTGKIKKDFSVKWDKDDEGKCDELRITFDRPDGVKPREIFEAMKSLNQSKLNEVFEIRHSPSFGDHPGVIRICIRGGFQLGTVEKESYLEYLASDENTMKEETKASIEI